MAVEISNPSEFRNLAKNKLVLEHRRGVYIDVKDTMDKTGFRVSDAAVANYEKYDLIYRTLCAVLFNFASSGHPGGSTSCGRFTEGLLFNSMDYDFENPAAKENDVLSYGAGHKAMGQYAMFALRNEMVRVGRPDLLPDKQAWQMRLEDLLGFRRNPITSTPLFKKYASKALDGHAGPNVPFVPISTGPSGVATAATCGFALAALDSYGEKAPWIHVIEGEAGMTAGRVHEVLGLSATNQLKNLVMHLDWNQASIDSEITCREGSNPGDYVQWTPAELGFVNDWNVIYVEDGFDFKQILAAQEAVKHIQNEQPTMVVYRTVKGWRYGIEGKKSHGAGHGFCSDDYYHFVKTFEQQFNVTLPRFDGDSTPTRVEECYWNTLINDSSGYRGR